MKKLTILLCLFISINLLSQKIYRTQIFNPSIKTLQIGVKGEKMGLPIIELNSANVLQVGFDEMSFESHYFSYKVVHCNADWTESNINSNEYLSGFTTANITNYVLSVNTTVLYTHYTFDLPSSDMGFKISGNYVVIIYEDNQQEKPIAQACFSVVEPHVKISANIRGNSDFEMNTKWQQLDFDVELNGFSVRNASSEIKVLIRQNNRTDNEVFDVKPTYFSNSKLSYINNRNLVFEGGNEYHRFDISNVYGGGQGVDIIRFVAPTYNAYLIPDKIQTSKTYMQEMDVNGKFIINMQRAQNDDTEADYMNVHFTLPAKQPFFDGQIYLGGEFNYNLLNNISRMKYDATTESYTQTILLKQGGYNYQYWFSPKGSTKASSERVDGSYWQTLNEYTIYIYHRAWGERYDRLVGIKSFTND
jgi:hypothetical protein